MEPGIVLILIVAGIVAGAAGAWVFLSRRLPPDALGELASIIAAISSALSGVITYAEVEAIAGWLYDSAAPLSRYLSRQQFIDLVWRALTAAPEQEARIVAMRKMRVPAHDDNR